MRLFEAAADAFAAKGFHATTTRDIASRAGLSPAGVYVHFASKEEILASALHRANGFVQVDLDEVLAATDDPEPLLVRSARRAQGFTRDVAVVTVAARVDEKGELVGAAAAALADRLLLQFARNDWEGDRFDGENADPYWVKILGRGAPIDDIAVALRRFARRIWLPLLEHLDDA